MCCPSSSLRPVPPSHTCTQTHISSLPFTTRLQQLYSDQGQWQGKWEMKRQGLRYTTLSKLFYCRQGTAADTPLSEKEATISFPNKARKHEKVIFQTAQNVTMCPLQVTRKDTTDILQKKQVKTVTSEKPTFLHFNINNNSFILVTVLMRIISSRQ